jgi:hypothetical protein
MTDRPAPAATIGSIIENITRPQPLASLYSGQRLRLTLHRSATESRELELPEILPFLRVYDLKLAIFKYLRDNELAVGARLYPEYLFVSFSQIPGTRRGVDFQWFVPGQRNAILLAKPFDVKKMKKMATDFVDENGSKRLLTLMDTSNMLIENTIKVTDLHVYLYDDMKEFIGESTELKWNGFLHPYFPQLSYEADELDKKRLEKRYQRFVNTVSLADNLNNLLTDELDLRFTGVRRLQMKWEPRGKMDVESLFYSAPVTEARPYMRLMPNKGVSITKLHLQDSKLPDPDLARVIKQWTRERNPNPENDYVMSKFLLKKGEAQQNPIYATLRFGYAHKEEYADLTVLPPKGVRKLDTLFTEMERDGRTRAIVKQFESGIDKLPYMNLPIHLQNASLDYLIQLPAKPVFTKATLKARLTKFLPFFQEIAPLPGVQPAAMLRFKCVDNFTNEGRISAFLTQYANLKLVKGETDAAILSVLEEEFQLDTETAQQYLGSWLQSRGDVSSVEGETVELNTGIDIAIFAQHPFFSFHLHHVTSEKDLQRVLNLLSLLFTASDESLRVSAKVAEKIKAVEAAALQVEVEEKKEEEAQLAAAEPESGLPEDDFWKQFAAEETEPLEEEVRNEYLQPANAAAVAPEQLDEESPSPALAPAPEGKIIADFFLTKLKEADKNLFDYTKTHPSLKKYVSMCAANVTRQPAVMSRAQFVEMRDEIYDEELNADPPRIAFVEYPLQKGKKTLPRPEKDYEEVFFFLRFGTTPQKMAESYYVCSKYFCGRDELILLEKDFKGTRLRRPVMEEDGRERKTKAPNTCPFCEGKPVINRRSPGLNETVLIRQEAPKTQGGIFHKYVGFLKKTPHPEGFHLPCCFIDNETITEEAKYYDKFREIRQAQDAPAAAPAQAQEPPAQIRRRDEAMFPQQPYLAYMARAFTKYIVGSEKLPLEIDDLEGPQIGLLPPVLDEYFKQDISNFINPKTPHKLKPDAEGFLRIGVENRARFKTDSFLAAIAPYYMQRSAREMKALIKQSLQAQPSIFFQLNYGNFLLEFYDIQMKSPTTAELQRWLEGTDINNWLQTARLQIPGSKKRKVMERFYLSYNSFMGWLEGESGYSKGWIERDDTMKEFRQLASLLAQPDFILRLPNMDDTGEDGLRPGLTFIVLDVDAANKLQVRCPPYGFNKGVHLNNDVAFLMHHHSGVWEPIFHVNKGRYSIFFQRGWKKDAEEISWPSVVKERKREYESICVVNPRLSYAARLVGKSSLIPASVLYLKMMAMDVEFNGILRDPYNHLAALVFNTAEGLIPVPCIDDGHIFPATVVYLDWADINPTAAPKNIMEFYETYVVNESEFKTSRGDKLYTPIQVWYQGNPEAARIFAILLRNNALIPVKRYLPLRLTKEGEDYFYIKDQFMLPAVLKNPEEMEWEMNKQILGLSRSPVLDEEASREATTLSSKELSEIFEHLRITFAKWLSKNQGSGEVRKTLEEIIYGLDDRGTYKASLSEKRKELYTYLSSTVFSWFSDAEAEGRPRIQRVDCTSLDKTACSGRCVWNVSNQCLIHTPKNKVVENLEVDLQYLLFFKLIEELLRYAEKRRELFEDDVSQTGTIDRRIQDGDQEILPENTAAWYERLRGDWVRSTEETPRFFEEISVAPVEEVVPIDEETSLPPPLESFLGKNDLATSRLRLLRAPLAELLQLVGTDLSSEITSLSQAQVDELSRVHKISIAQIDIRTDPPAAIFKQFKLKTFNSTYFILVITDAGSALLLKDPSTKELPIQTDLPKQLQFYFNRAEKKVGGALVTRRTRKNLVLN